MQDVKARYEKLITDAADCELIANLATDPAKREAFQQLARQARRMADEFAAEIAAREGRDAAQVRLGRRGTARFAGSEGR